MPIPITYLIGDATQPRTLEPVIIAHIVNDLGAWGAGFVLALSRRWKTPERKYLHWAKGQTAEPFGLGRTQFVEIDDRITVANMCAQHGLRSAAHPVPLRYEALAECLDQVADRALELNAEVHLPRIGCGLAGGTWEQVEPLLVAAFGERDIPVFVYDLK